MTRKQRKARLWHVDPSLFDPLPQAGFLERRFLSPGRRIGKYVLFGLAFAYPTLLVTLGLYFGGLVFWSSLGGSTLVIWFVLKRTGYAQNFAGWDVGYRKFVGLFGAFGMTLAFVYGLGYSPLKIMTIPVLGGILVLVLVIGMWRISSK